MSRIVTPGSSSSDHRGPIRSQPFFATYLIRQYGAKAVLAIVVAALMAFAPLGVLYWFNEIRLESVSAVSTHGPVQVKQAQEHDDQERDEPGETGLLQVTCEIPTMNGWRELLQFDDPASDKSVLGGPYAHEERVYARRAGLPDLPFGLLGRPPVSVWLPAGSYEVLVVYRAPTGESRIDAPGKSYPWLSALADCSLENKEKVVCNVQLPHFANGNPDWLLRCGTTNASTENGANSASELAHLISSCEAAAAIPTPAGYVLSLEEPQIQHQEGHRGCSQDFTITQTLPREWTRDQIVTLRNWLPEHATAARAKLTGLVDSLGWRQFLEGWFCYASAAISGLVFTRWGAIAMLEPWRRGEAWRESIGLLIKIALFSFAIWFCFQVMTDGSGCRGPVSFRVR